MDPLIVRILVQREADLLHRDVCEVCATREWRAMKDSIGGQDAAHVSCNVQKTYDGETLIVRDLNLDIQRGSSLPCWGLPVRERPPA